MAEPNILIVTSGGFDPLHIGHIEYLRMAKGLYGGFNRHICIVNSDQFLINKKGYALLDEMQRLTIASELKCVDEAILSIDSDNTVCESLSAIFHMEQFDKMIFAKGGDRNKGEIPEAQICRELGIEIVDGLGDKIESSSNLVNRFKLKEGRL